MVLAKPVGDCRPNSSSRSSSVVRDVGKLKITCSLICLVLALVAVMYIQDAVFDPLRFSGDLQSGASGRRLHYLEYKGPEMVRHQPGYKHLVDVVFASEGNRQRTVCTEYQGIDHPNERGCCAEVCGRKFCGTRECYAGPSGKPGCCMSKMPPVWCSPTQMAPCLLNATHLSRFYRDSLCRQYKGIDSRDHRACCPSTCGEYCGASFCHNFAPISAAIRAGQQVPQCCTNEYSATCGPGVEAPCMLPKTTTSTSSTTSRQTTTSTTVIHTTTSTTLIHTTTSTTLTHTTTSTTLIHTTSSTISRNTTTSKIEYPGLPFVFSTGEGLSFSPRFGPLLQYTSFSVHPQLPKDLRLDPLTGEISGVLSRAAICRPIQTYTIFAMGPSGEATINIKLLKERMPPPIFLDYPSASMTKLSLGDRVKLQPNYIGGSPAQYTVKPTLLPGLTINVSTGEIYGVIEADANAVNVFVVTVQNACGNASAIVRLLMAPSYLSYSGLPMQSVSDNPISIVPNYRGDHPVKFAIEPAFPPGLTINPTTGAIVGALSPKELCHAPRTYNVTAVSPSHTISLSLKLFTHSLTAPSSLKYSDMPKLLATDDRVYVRPTYSGSHATRFNIEGALLPGLMFNYSTGEITGKVGPNPGFNQTQIVEASNACGKAVSTISWTMKTIHLQLSYTGLPENFVSYQHLSVVAVTGVRKPTHFAIHPALPKGLQFNEVTGSISGVLGLIMPTTYQTYLITARYMIGNATTTITLPKEVSLRYRGLLPAFTAGQEVNISATYIGDRPVYFAINPALPQGLTLNVFTGDIYGSLDKNFTMPKQRFVITATSSDGTITSEVTFAVVEHFPLQWLLVLVLLMILGVVLYFGCRSEAEPPQKGYTQMTAREEPLSIVASAPVPVEESEPSSNLPLLQGEDLPWNRDGLALVFETETGDEKAVWATRKPLGLIFEKKLPIVITEEGDGHAFELGVKVGWTLISINDVDITSFADYRKVSDMLQKAISMLPGGLPLTFITEIGKEKTVYAMQKPLGLIYDKELPILIKEERHGDHGSAIGVRKGWVLKKINHIDISQKTNFDEVNILMHRWVNRLPQAFDIP